MSSFHSRSSYSSRTTSPSLYDRSPSGSDNYSRKSSHSSSRPPASPQHKHSPSSKRHSYHVRSTDESQIENAPFTSHLDRFAHSSQSQQQKEQRESPTSSKAAFRSARMRMGARRQTEQQRRSPSKERSSTPSKVSDLRRQLWGNGEVLKSPAGRSNTPEQPKRSHHIRQSFSHQEETSTRSRTRSLSPFRARSTSFEQGSTFQSKYFEAAIAAQKSSEQLPSKPELVKRKSSGSRPFDEPPSAASQRSTQQQPLSSSPRRNIYTSNNSYEKPPTPRNENYIQSSSSRSFRTTGSHQPLASPSYKKNASPSFTDKSSFDVSEKAHRLSEAHEANEIERGRAVTIGPKRAISKERPHTSARSPSPFVERRMRAFSKEPHGRDMDGIDSGAVHEYSAAAAGTPSKLHRASRPSLAKRSPSIEQRVRREPNSPTSIQNPSRDKSVEHSRGSNVAKFWNAKQPGPPATAADISMQVLVSATPAKKETATNGSSDNLDLVTKLSAVDRGNPAEALAQIDTILREENKKNSFEPILINDVDSDDGTAVSSITNPTYQNLCTKPQDPAPAVAVRSPRPSNLQNYSTPSSMHNEIQKLPGTTKSTNPFDQQIPGNNAFRRPRPSNLQNYSTPSSVHNGIQKLPGTTKFSNPFDQQIPGKNALPRSSTNPYNDRGGLVLSRQSGAGSPSTSKSSRKSHPWDDNGENPPKKSVPFAKEETIIDIDEAVQKYEREQEIQQGRHTSSPAIMNDFMKETFHSNEPNAFLQSKDRRQRKNKASSTVIPPAQYENSRKISDNFDAAWASMPSTFTKSQMQRTSRSSGPVDLDMTVDSTSTADMPRRFAPRKKKPDDVSGGEGFSIEVSLYDPEMNQSLGTRNSESQGTSSSEKPKTKRRGFLKAFMRRQNNKKGTTASTYSESQASVGVHSDSHASGGMHSESHTSIGVRSLPTPQKSTTKAAAGFVPTSSSGFPQQQRGRTQSHRASPARSHSVDRFRTASMAEKYSRVMRLYDDE